MAGSGRKGPHYKNSAVARASLPGLAWPGLATQHDANLMALLYQLEQSQWWSPDQLRDHQFRQLTGLVQHVLNTVPYYRERYQDWGINAGWKLSPESFTSTLPILTRPEVQEAGDAFHSTDIPKAHGNVGDTFISGSTGRPLKTLKTGLSEMIW